MVLAMRGAATLLLFVLGAGGCESDQCTEMSCPGDVVQIAVVDEEGEPVLAKGEYRAGERNTNNFTVSFDCDPTTAGSNYACLEGELQVGPAWSEDFFLDVRFELPDGTFTEWQEVPLEITSETDPDFNGEGCSCTSFSAEAEPIVVPTEAQP
jgi:hypothetical protein